MMALGIRSWSRPHCARWGPSSPPQKSGQSPQFSAHFYCDQTAGCVKMPLRIEVSLSPGNFVLDGDPAPPPKGTEPPIFGPRLLWPNRCIDQDATWYGGRPRPTRHCVRCGPSYPQKKGHTHPAQFLAHVYCGHGRPSQLLLSSCMSVPSCRPRVVRSKGALTALSRPVSHSVSVYCPLQCWTLDIDL